MGSGSGYHRHLQPWYQDLKNPLGAEQSDARWIIHVSGILRRESVGWLVYVVCLAGLFFWFDLSCSTLSHICIRSASYRCRSRRPWSASYQCRSHNPAGLGKDGHGLLATFSHICIRSASYRCRSRRPAELRKGGHGLLERRGRFRGPAGGAHGRF